MYYRFTNSDSPMSDWEYAMLAGNRDSVCNCFGANEYTYDGSNGVDIDFLKDAIISAWKEDQKNNFDYCSEPLDDYYKSLDADEIFCTFNPEDIVDSAGAFDTELACWLWFRVLKPNYIYAVITNDGAIVYDETLLKKIEN